MERKIPSCVISLGIISDPNLEFHEDIEKIYVSDRYIDC